MTLPIQPTPLPPLDPSSQVPAGAEVAPTEGGARFEDALAGSAGGPEAVEGPAAATSAAEVFRADGSIDWMEAPQAMDTLMQYVVERGDDLKPHELIAVQMRVHEMSFQIETASKAIEHGMTSTKTLLQTQA